MDDDKKKLFKNLGLLAGIGGIGYQIGKRAHKAKRNQPIDIIKSIYEKMSKGEKKTFELGRLAIEGDIAAMQIIINDGVDINAKPGGEAALILAGKVGRKDVIKFLINNGADVNTKEDITNYTALMKMIACKEDDIVKLLLDYGADVNAKAEDGYTALMLAAKFSHIDIVKLLLDYGADVNAKAKDGYTALMCAVSACHVDIVKLLLNKGASVDEKNNDSATALVIALFYMYNIKNEDFVKSLIEKGYCGFNRETIIDIIKILLSNGADAHFEVQAGVTPTWLALALEDKELLDILPGDILPGDSAGINLITTMFSFLDQNADANKIFSENINKKRGKEGNTPLMMVANYGTAEQVQTVINKGGDVNIKDNNGYTALMHAIERGDPKIIGLLKNAGAKEIFIDEEKRDIRKLKETIVKSLEGGLEVIDEEAKIRGLTAKEIESRKNTERARWAKIEMEEIEKLERKYR